MPIKEAALMKIMSGSMLGSILIFSFTPCGNYAANRMPDPLSGQVQ